MLGVSLLMSADTLSQWEAEAKGQRFCGDISKYTHISGDQYAEINSRILALIDLVRKKDEALFHIGSKGSWIEGECFTNDIRFQGFSVVEIADDAIALTEQLK